MAFHKYWQTTFRNEIKDNTLNNHQIENIPNTNINSMRRQNRFS